MSVLKFVSGFVRRRLDALVPMHCQLCEQPAKTGYELCENCRDGLPWLVNTCPQCALPHTGGNSGLCGACLSSPPGFDRLVALFRYEGEPRDMVLQMKFANKLASARLMGELLLEALPYHLDKPDILLPVPLHASRIRHRGYNQSLELARPVAEGWGVRLWPQAARRLKATGKQSRLHARQRVTNIRGAFEVPEDVRGCSVLLLDDVATTGATLDELARSLKKAGAREVNAVVFARAV